MAYPVKWLHGNMQGAPVLNASNGDLTALLDACLVTGFNVKTVASITRDGATATVTIAAGHLYEIAQVVRISGCDQAEYNGDQRLLARTATTFTFAVSGTPASPATGSPITVKTAPCGWEIAFTGTNKRAYRSPNVESNRPYLRVDDGLDPAYNAAYAKKGKVLIAQGMSDIDTLVGRSAPYTSDDPLRAMRATGSGTSVYDGWYKWYYARDSGGYKYDTTTPVAGARSWFLVGDDRGFYFATEGAVGGGRTLYLCTDFKSYRANDAFNTLLVATEYWATAAAAFGTYGSSGADDLTYSTQTITSTGKITMAAHTQIGDNAKMFFASLGTRTDATTLISGYQTGVPFPNGPDYGLILHPVYLQEATTNHLRGIMPGYYFVHNNSPTLQHLSLIDGVVNYAGRQFLICHAQASENTLARNQARIAFDITGPWW